MTVPSAGSRRLPVNELIALGALVALAAWGLLVWSGIGGRPVPLGDLDPGRLVPGRGLTLAELPLVVMLAVGGLPLVFGLARKLLRPREKSGLERG
jgi:hypothetical protein